MRNHRTLSWLLLSLAIAPMPAYGEGLDELRARAACSRVRLSEGLGETASAADKNECGEAGTPRSAAPTGNPFDDAMPPEPMNAMAQGEAPDWLDSLPRKAGMLYGVGTGPDLTQAFRGAAALIAAQIRAEVEGSTRQFQSQETQARIEGHREVEAQTRSNSFFGESTKMMVKGSLADIAIEDQYKDAEGQIHVLASLNVEKLKQKEDDLVASVLSTLANATERLAGAFASDAPLRQESLADATSVLDDIDAFGRSEIGRQVKQRWRTEVKAYRLLVERAVNCVVVDDGANAKHPAGELRLQLTCHEKPLAEARMLLNTEGGLTTMPSTLVTDGKGNVRVKTGAVYGEGSVRLTFKHDTSVLPGSQWLEQRVDPRAMVSLVPSRAATASFRINGASDAERKVLLDALSGLAASRWGAKVGESATSSQLRGDVTVTFGNAQVVQGQTSLSAEAVIVVKTDEGTVFERRLRASSVAGRPDEARQKTISNLAQAIQRAK